MPDSAAPPPLHPIKDLGIKDETVSELLKQVETVETRCVFRGGRCF
jgi:hypothetical protein